MSAFFTPNVCQRLRLGNLGNLRRWTVPEEFLYVFVRANTTKVLRIVTAPLRAESLTEASNTPAAAAASYAQVKRTHLDTAAVCARQGLSFKPLVLECTGHGREKPPNSYATSQGPLLSGLDRTCPRYMASSCRSCVWLHVATAPVLCFDGVLDWPLPRRRTFLCNLSPGRCQPSESLLFLKGFLHNLDDMSNMFSLCQWSPALMLPLLYGRFSIISFHGLGDPPPCASAFPVDGGFLPFLWPSVGMGLPRHPLF